MEDLDDENEQVVSISDFIEDIEAQQLEADLVLGGDEGKECTYEKGYMKRQAVFSCLTCTPAGSAGFCTACSLVCHDGHDVVELWTRRNFRCDCGNQKFGTVQCKLFKDKEAENKGNAYNQNFGGLYCICHRPFPDPEGTDNGEMLQCCICEDWFHETHLGLSSSHQVPRDDDGEPSFDELVCPSCFNRCTFLSHYPDLLLSPLIREEGDKGLPSSFTAEKSSLPAVINKSDGGVAPAPATPGTDSHEVSCTNSDLSNSAAESPKDQKVEIVSQGTSGTANGQSSNHGRQLCKLKLRVSGDASSQINTSQEAAGSVGQKEGSKQGQAVFLSKSWRAELCQCESCLSMYVGQGVPFLMEKEDTLQEYEEEAKRKREEVQEKEAGTAFDFMKKLGHVQKIELMHGFNDLASELGSFLTPFGENGRTVTSEDIHEFFDKLQQKRRRKK